MQALFINPFLHAIQDVMTTMARIDATPDKPTLKRDSHAFGDVTVLIGLSDKQAQGSLAISFHESVILDITRRMIGERQSQLNDTITDMVGEITNIVSGGAKRALSEQGYDFDLAIPGVITGKGHEIRHPHSSKTILLTFTTEAGRFFVEINFRE
ncbi:MAG: chemotaxis protein CheX [Candidatus Sedimenticola endophacoides]